MNLDIRPVCDADIKALVQLSLLAWEPVFASFRQMLGPTVYAAIWPNWRSSQREAIEIICQQDDPFRVWVADLDGTVVGFLAYELNLEDKTGEVQLLAVHPDHQNQGIGTELNLVALSEMKKSGISMAKVETGGDPSHAPARRSYEKAGYTAMPLVRYFQVL